MRTNRWAIALLVSMSVLSAAACASGSRFSAANLTVQAQESLSGTAGNSALAPTAGTSPGSLPVVAGTPTIDSSGNPVVVDSSGNIIVDSSGKPIAPSVPGVQMVTPGGSVRPTGGGTTAGPATTRPSAPPTAGGGGGALPPTPTHDPTTPNPSEPSTDPEPTVEPPPDPTTDPSPSQTDTTAPVRKVGFFPIKPAILSPIPSRLLSPGTVVNCLVKPGTTQPWIEKNALGVAWQKIRLITGLMPTGWVAPRHITNGVLKCR